MGGIDERVHAARVQRLDDLRDRQDERRGAGDVTDQGETGPCSDRTQDRVERLAWVDDRHRGPGDDDPGPIAIGDDDPGPIAIGDDDPGPIAIGDDDPGPIAIGDGL